MKLLDRLIFFSYVRSYLLCLISLLGLYIIIDLFNNLKDFMKDPVGLFQMLANIAEYYLYQSAQIFDRLCEPIVMMAAMFTLGLMQRNNELMPLLSSGVPTRRVLRPVMLGVMALLALGIVNQELIIPRIANALLRDRDNLDGANDVGVQGRFNRDGIHIEGGAANPQRQIIKKFHCTIPEHLSTGLVHLSAREARYVPPGKGRLSDGWLLIDTYPARLDDWNNPRILEMIDEGRWFLHVSDIPFDTVIQNQNGYMYFSTAQLRQILLTSESRRLSPMAVLFHKRLTRPLMAILLVLAGLSIVLQDPNRQMYISAGLCMLLNGFQFGLSMLCKQLGDADLISPALAAWLPVFVFGPITFVLFDSIHT
jgi:lipopolysaccharide export system permease protein